MHDLIPEFIYEQCLAGEFYGRLKAVTLFLDISGFTTMTQALMQHGKEGAEVLAQIINRVFDPIINTIYDHGGFVSTFAGDALTVVFPHLDGRLALMACDTAAIIAQVIAQQGTQNTKYGSFALAVKQGLSVGRVEWGIVGTPTHKTYFFRGEAIDGCARSEHQAGAGDIILDSRVKELLSPPTASLQSIDGEYWRILALPDVQLETTPAKQWLQTAVDEQIANQFFPLDLWQFSRQGEFRDVAVVFLSFQALAGLTDLANFVSHLMSAVDRFGGYFNKLDFGDKGQIILLLFGAPIAHENNKQRALDFILTLEPALLDMAGLEWRAGATYGTVYAGLIGASRRNEYTALGSVVNLAARLMMQAKWGEVVVSQEVASHPGFVFKSLGASSYKGFAQPMPTYLLEGEIAAERVFQHKMVGRESELQQLVSFAQPLFAGQQAGVAVIYGEAGMGKSHLIHALRQELKGQIRWLTGQTDPVLREPFNPFVYFLKSYFSQLMNASEADNKANFSRQLDELLAVLAQIPGAERQYTELQRTHSFLGALVGLSWPDSLFEQLDAAGRYQNTMIAISMLLQAECMRQPVVLELEDGHWFEEASQELLTALTRQTTNVPLLILITSRYQDDGRPPVYPIAAQTPVLEIELTTLSDAAIQALARDILGMGVEEGLHRLLVEKSGANPFFAQQIMYYFRENHLLQVLERNQEQVACLTAEAFDLPATLNSLLVARLDRLTQKVKEVVQTAAVLGREFESRLLLQMLNRDLTEELMVAEKEQIWTVLNALAYLFNHVLLRDAAYEMQLRARLRDVHFLAAVTGEKLYASILPSYFGTLAYHYEAAYLFGSEEAYDKARHYLRQAGQLALGKFEHGAAIDYFSRALAMTNTTEVATQYQLLLAREKAYDMQGNRAAQHRDLAQMAALSGQIGMIEQATVALRQARYAEVTSTYKQVIPHAQDAIKWGRLGKNLSLRAEGHWAWGSALWRQAQYSAAQKQLHEGLRLAQEVDDHKQVANCLHGLGIVAMNQGDFTSATGYYKQSLAIRREIGDLNGEGDSLSNLGLVAVNQGDTASAKAYLEQALDIRHQIGDRYGEGIVFINLGEVAMNQGDYAAAREYYEQALATQLEIGDRSGEGISRINLGIVAMRQGNHAAAREYFEQALTIIREIGDRLVEGINLNELGAVAVAQAELEPAENYYQQALTIRQELNQPHYLVEDWAGLAQLSQVRGDRERAAQYAGQILRYLTENPRLKGAENSMRVFNITWEVLVTLGQKTAADETLALAVDIMQAYLDKNSDPVLQEMYLNQPHHRVLWAAWQKKQKA